MEVVETDLVYTSASSVFRFRHITDVHYGSRQCDEGLLDKVINEIRNEDNSYWWLGGDPCDFIVPHDSKRFDPAGIAKWITVEDLDNLPDVQTTGLAKKLSPLVGSCLGAQYGNHDDMIRLRYSQDVHQLLLGKLNAYRSPKQKPIPSLGYSAFHVIRFHKQKIRKGHGADATLTVFLHHGFFGGRLKGSKALYLERTFNYYDCDLALYGHDHDRLAFKSVCMTLEKRNGILRYAARTRAAVNSGAFLRTLSQPGEKASYTEVKGYYPVELGPIVVEYKPEKKELTVLQ